MDIIILRITAKTETVVGDYGLPTYLLISKTITAKVVYGAHSIDMKVETTDMVDGFTDARNLIAYLLGGG